MLCYIYRGSEYLRQEDRNPECGIDFCEDCGDCLACYGEFSCVDFGEEHYWMKQEEYDDE